MIRIERLTKGNLDAVWELEQICFPEDPWGRISFENELNQDHSVFLVAYDEEENMVVGYGGVWFQYDVGDVTNLAVHPDYRREGIGRKLLELLIGLCCERGMQAITLEVRETNTAAQKLYEGAGFTVSGIRKAYYKDRENAIIMTYQLQDGGVIL